MDIFETRYYRLNKGMLSCLGQWPLQSPKERYLFRTTTVLIVGSILVPKIIKFVESLGNINGMIECLPVLGIHFRSVSKFINCTVNAKKMEMLANHIKESWAIRTAEFENTILNRYAERARLLTVIYTVYLSTALLMFLSLPLIPIVLDIIVILNESRERIYPYETEYFVEKNEKYFYILAHAWFAMPFALGMIIAYDTMFAVNVHHACSVFAMLGWDYSWEKPIKNATLVVVVLRQVRLESIGRDDNKNDLITEVSCNRDKSYEELVTCIKIHKEAVELAKLLESSGYVCYLFVVGVSMLVTTLTGFMTVTNLDQPGEALRYGAFAIGEVVHLFYLCWQGHVLVEHSENIFINAYNVDWYDISPRAKKLLILIMIRSAEPCQLTAGKIYILSMENFAAALKTSMSYFTVLLSMQ